MSLFYCYFGDFFTSLSYILYFLSFFVLLHVYISIFFICRFTNSFSHSFIPYRLNTSWCIIHRPIPGAWGQSALAHVLAGVLSHVTPRLGADWQINARDVTRSRDGVPTLSDVGPTTGAMTATANSKQFL